MQMPSETLPRRRRVPLGAPWRPVVAAAACALLLTACSTAGQGEAPVIAPPAVSPEVVAVAEQAIEQGRYQDAKLLLERVLLSEPNNPRARLGMAEVQLAFKSLAAAEKSFAALTEVPEVADRARQGRGIALLVKGEEQAAALVLQQAVTEDPSLWRAWNALGLLHDRNGAWAEATAAYDRALELRPDSAMLYNNRGFSYLLRREPERAIADFDTALRIDPRLVAAQENLRLAFAWTGQYERALLGVSSRDFGRAYNNVGFVALLRGDLPAAESYLLRSMEADAKFNRIANKNLEYLRGLKAIDASKTESQS
jgi:Flp pilus assembly protein TadD